MTATERTALIAANFAAYRSTPERRLDRYVDDANYHQDLADHKSRTPTERRLNSVVCIDDAWRDDVRMRNAVTQRLDKISSTPGATLQEWEDVAGM